MGMRTVIPGSNSQRVRKEHNDALYKAIHKARVFEVDIEKGTVKVQLEKVPYTVEATMPLVGMSVPPLTPDPTGEDAKHGVDFKASSWGRYIPQVGDILLVGFGMDGTVYSLGYSALFYKGVQYGEQAEESTGGLNWGTTVGKRMKPGDWDFKSARNANLYLGDKAKLSAGSSSVNLSKFSADITSTAPLIMDKATQSEARFGAVRRRVLPTDSTESPITSSRGADQAQESTTIVKWNNSTPQGGILTEYAMGDVIEDSTTGSSLRTSSQSQPVRRYFLANDLAGATAAYEESVDVLGNYEVSSSLATNFTWDTPLCSWEISNLSTKIASTSTVEITADTTLILTGTTGVVVDGATIKFGGDSASEPFVLGLKWQEFAGALVAAIGAHTHLYTPPNGFTGPPDPASWTAASLDLQAKILAAISALVYGS
ncbi:hypothetical protein N8Z24_00490 [bacterium]|nr:hypothetical protein [bacterium]